MIEICKNNPEYIQDLARRILNGEDIQFNGGLRSGKTSFMVNLMEAIMNEVTNK